MNPDENKKPKWKLIVLIIVGVVVLLAAGGTGVYFWQKNEADKKVKKIQDELDRLRAEEEAKIRQSNSEKGTTQNQTTLATTANKEVVPSYATDWYKFVSPNYGFSFRYPKVGVDVLKAGQPAKACSYPLKVTDGLDASSKANGVTAFWIYAEFFALSVRPANQSIASFIKSADPDGYRSYSSINVAGAKEAVKINPETTRPFDGYPPLSYVHYILNDGKNFYLMMSFQDNGFSGDCAPKNITDTMGEIIGTWNFYN